QIDISGNSTKAQQQRLLLALKKQPLTTIAIRRNLDIIAPAPRVFELRHKYGYDIITHWKYEPTDCGKLHRVALYALLGEGEAL
ncbi:MAG: helix-turn-helix domain-containing protein, partial [Pseudomonadota bacterium]